MMEQQKNPRTERPDRPSASFLTGVIALVFLVIGYQTALFVHQAAVARLTADRDRPDTVYVVDPALALELWGTGPGPDADPEAEERIHDTRPAGATRSSGGTYRSGAASPGRSYRPGAARPSGVVPPPVRRNAPHSERAVRLAGRRVEQFRFDPNTVSAEDLQRLGFSERQAAAIVHYREAGGRFRRKSDFAKSYVVDDSVYERLAPYIDIPRLDINRADSAAFETLPGIGPWFAARMVSYRERLGGYSYPEQLMDIPRFDAEKYAGLQDLICCPPADPYPLWTLPESALRQHPYIGAYAARGILVFRDNHPKEQWTVDALLEAGILVGAEGKKLSRCRIADP